MANANENIQQAINDAPEDTSGLVVVPWNPAEVYGVAANWSQASAQVYIYGDDEWITSGRQVADYQHSAIKALEEFLLDDILLNDGTDSSVSEIVESSDEF